MGPFLSEISAEMASPSQDSSFSGSSQGLDARRIENHPFTAHEQMDEQVNEPMKTVQML